MTEEAKKRPYADKFGVAEQEQMEGMIAHFLSEPYDQVDEEEHDEICDRYPEKVCHKMAQEILFNILRTFRPDLFVEIEAKTLRKDFMDDHGSRLIQMMFERLFDLCLQNGDDTKELATILLTEIVHDVRPDLSTFNSADDDHAKWVLPIADRLLEDTTPDYDEETDAVVRELVEHGLKTRPDLVEKLIGTPVIEEDYFEELK